ncbi:MAG: AAA family ATPase [Faecalimonas sp.]|nr:AAA family ATPase [Faecalimonas sp.]
MSKGREHLKLVSEKLNKKIHEMSATILEVQKDIESMNDYYWENYTEMDQYGYEDFDNQRALLNQVNANTENRKMLERLRKMAGSPFFGSVEFQYEGEEVAEDFYIGIGNFAERTGGLPLIYDWRAPVSGLFYDYDKGHASYEAPGGMMEGEILSKWQYKIRNNKMIYEFESDVKIDDDILKQELGNNGDVQLKNIVSTIQKEQNAIIRNTKDKVLAIQGAAGSGKTSVALHRIAYLLYHDREKLKSSNVLILSPNSVFSDYISHVLPELGEEHIQEMSFDLFAYRELRDVVADCEDRYHHIENRMQHLDAEAEERYHWKQSQDFVGAVEAFLVLLEDDLMNFKRFEYRGFTKTAEELVHLFYFKFTEHPLLSRMEAVMEYVLDEYETLARRSIEEEEKVLIREWFMSMYETMDIYKIYNWILKENGFPTLPHVPLENRVLSYEDVYPILYLKQRLCSMKKHKNIRHLVIDEMQDYSYLQYVILQNMFSCNMTILGDKAQTVDDRPQDILRFLPKIFGKEIRKIEMKRSYRNTLEIAEYASNITGLTGIEYLERHGKPVVEQVVSSEKEGLKDVLKQVSVGTDKYETAAILTMTEVQAKAAYKYLKQHREDVFYIDRDSSEFCKGVTVTTYYLAKGLEFDQVFVLGGEKDNPFYTQFKYISATRALHELYVYDVKKEGNP